MGWHKIFPFKPCQPMVEGKLTKEHPFKPCQPLVDSKHRVNPGCASHPCAALTQKSYCRTANTKGKTITANLYIQQSRQRPH